MRFTLAILLVGCEPCLASGGIDRVKAFPAIVVPPLVAARSTLHIASYYPEVDRRDFGAVKARFSRNAVYRREGWADLEGPDAIEDFFVNRRKLQGVHTVLPEDIRYGVVPQRPHLLIPTGRPITVKGRFKGLWDGQPIELDFEDLWILRALDDEAIFRQSWISKPGV